MNYLLRGIGVLATVGTISMLAFSLPSARRAAMAAAMPCRG